MRSRNNPQSQPSGDTEFESWITGLTDGETSARRLRQRLDAGGASAEGACAVCAGAATSTSGHEGHEVTRLTA